MKIQAVLEPSEEGWFTVYVPLYLVASVKAISSPSKMMLPPPFRVYNINSLCYLRKYATRIEVPII